MELTEFSTDELPEFGSVAEAAIVFRCGERAVRTGVETETIPSVRLGRTIRIPLRLIMERLAAEVASVEEVTTDA